jgi:hypothetical protein
MILAPAFRKSLFEVSRAQISRRQLPRRAAFPGLRVATQRQQTDEQLILAGQYLRCTCDVNFNLGSTIAGGSVGYFDDNFTAPVRRAFEHLVSLTGLIEPQHFAHFTL